MAIEKSVRARLYYFDETIALCNRVSMGWTLVILGIVQKCTITSVASGFVCKLHFSTAA